MRRPSERGAGRFQFLVVMTVIIATAYAGYLYVPVAFHAHTYKDLMQHYADVSATQGYPPSWAGEQLLKNAAEYDIPSTAVITPVKRDDRIEVRVQYIQPIEFPGYTYNYEFDHTVKSTAFFVLK
jgi:hypothetical protein